MYPTKIATCCHCGSKAVLTLDKRRHELACTSCGAPLRQMKMLPVASQRPTAVSHQHSVRDFGAPSNGIQKKNKKLVKPKKRKAWFKDWAEDVFDLVEDVFD